jgi:photosystem II stability/assembly factor-like uncharacterized protein
MNIRSSLFFLSLTFFFLIKGIGQCDTSLYYNYVPAFNQLAITENGVMVAVSEYAPFLRSEDNGKTWEKVNIGEYGRFQKVFFTSDQIGYTYTQDVLLKTEDAGKTWFPLLTPMQPPHSLWDDFTGAFFVTDNRGFLVNGRANRLYSTIDGGRSFNDTLFDYETSIKAVHVADSLHAVLYSYENSFYTTQDGGKSWMLKKIEILPAVSIGDMKMVSKDTIFALLRSGQVIRTVNGGGTWTVLLNLSNYTFTDEIFAINASTLFVVSGNVVNRSTNGGNSWKKLENLHEFPIRGLGISPDKKRLTVAGGGSFAFSQMMAISDDKGNTWDTLSFVHGTPQAMHFPDAQKGYLISGNNWFLKTKNGGITWNKVGGSLPFAGNGSSSSNKKIQFLNEKVGYAYTDQLFTSTDSGKNWGITNMPSGYDIHDFLEFHFLNDSVGFLADRYGIYKTVNRGQSWKKVLTTASEIKNFYINPKNGIGLAVGFGGFVQRTQNFGATWQKVTFNADALLVSAFVLNDSTAFMGTIGNILYRSTDGGLNWQSRLVDNYINVGLRYFLFSGNDSGIVVSGGIYGVASRAFSTTDGGDTWKLINGLAGSFKGIGGTVGDPKYLNYNDGLTFKQIPRKMGKLGYVYGRLKTCPGEKVVYKVHQVDRATGYMWTASGNPISSVSEFADTLIWQSPGMYQVTAYAFDDCTLSNPQTILVEVVPHEPKIEKVSDTLLQAVTGEKFQWYLNNLNLTEMTGSSGQTLKVETSGLYKASITNENGCTNFSNEVYMIVPTYHCPGKVLLLNGMVSSGTNLQWQMDMGNGYQDIADGAQFQGVHLNYLRISPVGAALSGTVFRCRYTHYTGATRYGGETKIVFANKWNGAQNSNWENPLNWSCGAVPDENTEVTVLSGTIQIQSNVTIKKLFVAPGAAVNVLPGFTLQIKG